MGLFSRKSKNEAVAGRASLQQGSFSQDEAALARGNRNDLSAAAHVRLPALLQLVSAEDGGTIPPEVQQIS